jgi:hypothetical protein
MKKTIGIAAAFLFCASAIFAQNYTKGIDITVMPEFAGSSFSLGSKTTISQSDMFGVMRIDSFDSFWLNNHLGIYGMMSADFGGKRTISMTIDGHTDSDADDDLNATGAEFIIGPSFATNLGSRAIRFQVGAGLHMLYLETDYDYKLYTISYTENVKEIWTGFGADAQFRFTANKHFSPVVGMTLTVDSGYSESYDDTTVTSEGVKTNTSETKDNSDFDKVARVGFTPYIALGINF